MMVDSSVWIAAKKADDVWHAKALPLARQIAEGKAGTVAITDYIFDEVVGFLFRRVGHAVAIETGAALLDSPHVEIIQVDRPAFSSAFALFRDSGKLSFTDCTTLAVMRRNGIESIASFDRGFDGLAGIKRLEKLP